MPTHIRTQARVLVAGRLAGLATTGANVFQNRVTTLPKSKLPAVSVSTGDEDIQRLSQGVPRRLGRTVQIHVDMIAEADDSDDTADLLDQIALEVEAALAPGSWSDALFFDIAPRAINPVFDGEGRLVAGQLRLTFDAEYQTAEGSPGTVI